MSSYIFVNKSRAALKERVEALEVELANLKDHLTSDKEEEEGTARIEQFDSEDLFFEQQKEDKLKKSIETDLKKAIESEVAKVKFHFETKDLFFHDFHRLSIEKARGMTRWHLWKLQ